MAGYNLKPYPGDEKCKEILKQYGCKLSFPEVRAFLMGCISAVDHVPMDAMFSRLQNGDEPNFNSMKDAQTYMGTVMGLWNKLAGHQDHHNPFCLSSFKLEPTRESLEKYLKLRGSEIKQFVKGLDHGGTNPDDFSEPGRFDIEQLAKMDFMYENILKIPESGQDDKEIPKLVEQLRQMNNMVEECINGVIQETKQIRAEMMQNLRGSLSHKFEQKVGRNEPCPCGSAKKYKKCCLEKSNNASSMAKVYPISDYKKEEPQESEGKMFQLKISLNYSDPLIWRRVLVPATFTFDNLHSTIQASFDWENDHMHEFTAGKAFRGEKISGRTPLSDFFERPRQKATYVYDFGDSWEHEILFEKWSDEKSANPVCLEGANAAPPEDSGGIPGYYWKLETIQNKKHPDYESMLEWMGENFDPVFFDKDAVNKRLKRIKGKRRKLNS